MRGISHVLVLTKVFQWGRSQLNNSTQKREPTIHREMSKVQRSQAAKQKEYIFSKLAGTYDWRSPNSMIL